MEFKIKFFDELSKKELYQILAIRNDVFVVEQNCIYNDCDGKDLKSYHLLVKESDTIIAYLRIIPKGISYDDISIGRVVVSKNNRSKKIATNMLIHAISFIEDVLNEQSIRISAQAHLYEFYSSVGFKKVANNNYLEDGIPHIEMVYNKV